MGHDVRRECLDLLDRRIKREEETLMHLRRIHPEGDDNSQAIRLLIKYLREVVEDVEKVPP